MNLYAILLTNMLGFCIQGSFPLAGLTDSQAISLIYAFARCGSKVGLKKRVFGPC